MQLMARAIRGFSAGANQGNTVPLSPSVLQVNIPFYVDMPSPQHIFTESFVKAGSVRWTLS